MGDPSDIEALLKAHAIQERARATRDREPTEFPPMPVEDYRRGAGSPHLDPPPQRSVEATQKAFLGVWGILVVMFGCAAAGWTVHAFITKPLIAEAVKDEVKDLRLTLVEVKSAQESNQKDNEKTFASIATNIEWLKSVNKVVDSQPITKPPEKSHR